ncbi:hypothetical protein TL5118_02917 [Thalassovita autumnalis]|uniref:Uncharacterized protein n=1 Tax=Thalassovita autumnalis TaxID=2072972 RepID=A0A0P1FUD2_9RHOB|nr:hypothetical protein TL5118_02917 [Thalassovita autumnalis]CUH72217.1 hypothetical protein TL5120_02013 [Thalassovita autumnalis]
MAIFAKYFDKTWHTMISYPMKEDCYGNDECFSPRSDEDLG